MFNELIVGTVRPFSGTTTPDKNGNDSIMIQCMAGKMPNRQVLSGTVAERQGFEIGKTYLIRVLERGYDKVFGLDFSWTKVMEITDPLRVVELSKKENLGKPQIINIPRPEGFEKAYERKGDAVESLQTKRIREGNYIPSSQRNFTEHETAKDVKAGTSIIDALESQNLSEEDLKEANRKSA